MGHHEVIWQGQDQNCTENPAVKMIFNIIKIWLPGIFLISFLVGQGNVTLVVTGSVHGQLDPCG